MADFRFQRRIMFQTAALVAGGRIAARSASAVAAQELPSGIPKLKIKSVRTYRLQHTLERPFGVSVSVPLDKTREALLVRIEADSGLVGWGETSPINGTRATIDQRLRP